VRFNKHLPTAEALGAYFTTYGRHCRTLHLGHLDAASEQVGQGCLAWGFRDYMLGAWFCATWHAALGALECSFGAGGTGVAGSCLGQRQVALFGTGEGNPAPPLRMTFST